MSQENEPIALTQTEAAAAFTEWERRYRADPEGFTTRLEDDKKNPSDLGEVSAAFFFRLLSDLSAATPNKK